MPLRATVSETAEAKHFPGFLHAHDAGSWPDRRRGLSNFLTWAFFLAEVLVADLFFGKGAKAADDVDPTSKTNNTQAGTADALSAPEPVVKAAEPDVMPADPLLDAGSSAMPQVAMEAGAAPGPSGVNGNQFAGSFPGGGGGGGSGAGSTDGAGGSSAVGDLPDLAGVVNVNLGDLISNLQPEVAIDLGLDLQPLDLSFGIDGSFSPLDIGFELGAPFLDLGFGASPLSDFGVLGEVPFMQLGDATGLSLFQGFGSPAEFGDLGEIAPLGGSLDAQPSLLVDVSATFDVAPGGHISSGGSIVFAASQSTGISGDELFSDGRYTDYNLALQSETTQSGNATAPAQSPDDPDALSAFAEDLGQAQADAVAFDQDLLRIHSL